MAYDIWKSVMKMVKAAIFYGLPLVLFGLMEFYPEIASMTIGTALMGIANYAKNKD